MPTFTYTVADFVAFTKIRSADVNSRFQDIKTFFNTTKLDDSNIQDAGITRATKLKVGTAGALVVNAAVTGAMSELTSGALGTLLQGAGTTIPPTFLAAGTAGQYLRTNGAGAAPTYVAAPDSRANFSNGSFTTTVGSSAMTVALKTNAGTDPTATDVVTMGFRNATAATGTYVIRSITGALSIIISSGATLGLKSAVNQFIHIYALDNAGTVELAVAGGKVFDDGTIASTTVMNSSSDSATVLYSTTARSNVAIKYVGRLISNQTVSGTYASAATESVSGDTLDPAFENIHSVYADTGNAYGSSQTAFRRFTNTTTVGTAITYADSATNGASFTINKKGLYHIDRVDQGTSGSQLGVSVNVSSGTTAPSGLPVTEAIIWTGTSSTSAHYVGVTYRFNVGDIVRPTDDPAAQFTNTTANVKWNIIYLGP